MRIDARWLIASSLVLVVAACGKKAQPATEQAAAPAERNATVAAQVAAVTEPCTLLTAEDVKDATGKPAQTPVPNNTNPRVCDIAVGEYGSVNVTYEPGSAESTPEQFVSVMNENKIPLTEQTGVGDRAFFADHGSGMIQLNGFKGHGYVSVTMLIPDLNAEQGKAAAIKLVNKALSRI